MPERSILLTTNDAKTGRGAEAYELTVAPDSVVIRAPDQAGLFYGVQTLLQLLPPEVFSALYYVTTHLRQAATLSA